MSLSSTIENVPIGKFLNVPEQDKCEPHVFRGHLIGEQPLRVNWTFHETKEENKKNNVTFRLNYTPNGEPFVYRKIYTSTILADCQLHLKEQEVAVTDQDLPSKLPAGCQLWFPSQESGHGIVIELTRLNVPCSKGFVHFSGLNTSQHVLHGDKGYGHYKSHKQAHLCGKLEELSENERHIYFPSSHTRPVMHLQGDPIFSISYRFVDYCYNVTFTSRNGSYELKPNGDLQCTFKIFLPYGYRVALKLRIGDNSSRGSPETDLLLQDNVHNDHTCDGLHTHLQDGPSSWTHCTHPGDAERHIEIVSRENKIVIKVKLRSVKGAFFGLRLSYRAEPVESIAGVCDFGWIELRQFCVASFEGVKLPWSQAEMECVRKGGHLVSIRSQQDQEVMNRLLINSYFTEDELRKNITPVCQQWREVAEDPTLWKMISFCGNKAPSSFVCAKIWQFKLLEKIAIRNRSDSRVILRQICRCTENLTHLVFRHCTDINEDSLRYLITSCKKLQSLDLKGTTVKCLIFYEELVYAKALREVNFGDNPFFTMKNLMTVIMNLSTIHGFHLASFKPADKIPLTDVDCYYMLTQTVFGLKSLTLDCSTLSSYTFSSIFRCCNLEYICLNYAYNLEGKEFENLWKTLTKLKVMKIRFAHNVKDSNMKGLFEKGRDVMDKLEVIDFTGCTQVGERGLEALVECCSKLKSVVVRNCLKLKSLMPILNKYNELDLLNIAFCKNLCLNNYRVFPIKLNELFICERVDQLEFAKFIEEVNSEAVVRICQNEFNKVALRKYL